MHAGLTELLQHLHAYGPFTTKSAAARAFADEIAEAASRGFVTSLLNDEASRSWRLTPRGLAVLAMETQ